MLKRLFNRTGPGRAEAGAKLRPARDVLTAEKDGLAVLLDLRRAVYFGLDEVGTAAWRQIESGASPEVLVSRIAEEYDAPAHVIDEDMQRFVRELHRNRLVVNA